ncbi:MAG: DUF1844 domain-containing protein [Thermoleophilia bacterium]|nr:DUF1844 domain-containing protein [Thermoleophilia bacterium]MDH3725274.1 DUF1844 domain-containing protein [Thermoleophilia bacterium]
MSDETTTGEVPSEEELAERFAAQLAKTDVRDILLQSLATLIDSAGIRLGFGPLGDEGRDLAQAKQAIEGASALVGVVEREVGTEEAKVFQEPLRVIKMAYVQATQAAAAPAGDESTGEAETVDPAAAQPPPATDRPEAGDAASRLWVPPGSRRDG